MVIVLSKTGVDGGVDLGGDVFADESEGSVYWS